jgi:hypothetical protein
VGDDGSGLVRLALTTVFSVSHANNEALKLMSASIFFREEISAYGPVTRTTALSLDPDEVPAPVVTEKSTSLFGPLTASSGLLSVALSTPALFDWRCIV